jgi:hypothetical protein
MLPLSTLDFVPVSLWLSLIVACCGCRSPSSRLAAAVALLPALRNRVGAGE